MAALARRYTYKDVRGGELPEDGWTKDEEKSLDLAVKKFAEPVSPDFTSLPVGGVSRIVTSLAVRARPSFHCILFPELFARSRLRFISGSCFWNLFLERFVSRRLQALQMAEVGQMSLKADVNTITTVDVLRNKFSKTLGSGKVESIYHPTTVVSNRFTTVA
eukprot:COSAG06_NODE_186_length_20792_cov_1041.487443_10_plen_162_part_00